MTKIHSLPTLAPKGVILTQAHRPSGQALLLWGTVLPHSASSDLLWQVLTLNFAAIGLLCAASSLGSATSSIISREVKPSFIVSIAPLHCRSLLSVGSIWFLSQAVTTDYKYCSSNLKTSFGSGRTHLPAPSSTCSEISSICWAEYSTSSPFWESFRFWSWSCITSCLKLVSQHHWNCLGRQYDMHWLYEIECSSIL